VSYGVYLWHVPLLVFARGHGVLPPSFVPALLVTVPVVLLVSAASWYLVERPLMARADRPLAPRPGRRRQSQLEEAHAAP
jgi:peptidoglycan/LPS O-acetylase OafA/YrhL